MTRVATEAERLEWKMRVIRKLVDEQADDRMLWLLPTTERERYLQTALRRMHGTVKDDELDWLRKP